MHSGVARGARVSDSWEVALLLLCGSQGFAGTGCTEPFRSSVVWMQCGVLERSSPRGLFVRTGEAVHAQGVVTVHDHWAWAGQMQ